MAEDKLQDMIDTNFQFYKQITDDAEFAKHLFDFLFQRYRKRSSFSSEPGRTSTQIVPRRWSTSSAIRRRPMNPVAPVTK